MMAAYSQQPKQVSPSGGSSIQQTRPTIQQDNPPSSSSEMAPNTYSPQKTTKGVRTYPGYDRVAALVAGSAQVIIGGLLIILGISAAALGKRGHSAHPIWGGIIIVIAGVFGILSAKNKRRDFIIITLAISAFGIILDFVFWGVGGASIGWYKSIPRTSLTDDLVALWALVILFSIIHFIFVVVQIIFCAMALRQTCVVRQNHTPGQIFTNAASSKALSVLSHLGTPTKHGQIGPVQGGNQPCISLPLPMDPKQTYTIIYGPDKSGVNGCYFVSIMPEYSPPQAQHV